MEIANSSISTCSSQVSFVDSSDQASLIESVEADVLGRPRRRYRLLAKALQVSGPNGEIRSRWIYKLDANGDWDQYLRLVKDSLIPSMEL